MTHGPDILAHHADVFRTKVGAAFPGSRAVFRGHDLHRELMGTDWFSLCAYAALADKARPEQIALFNTIWVSSSYPDARLWNNRIAALGGTARSTPNLSISGAQAMTEAALFGRGNEFRATDFFIKTQRILDHGTTLAEHLSRYLAEGHRLPGYGRPISSVDERIPIAMNRARELGLADGRHVKLAHDIERHFDQLGKPLRMNLGALISAFAADFGWTPREFNLFVYASFVAGMLPCYLEAADKPPGATFPIRCADVVYEGPSPRAWPTR